MFMYLENANQAKSISSKIQCTTKIQCKATDRNTIKIFHY